MVSVFGICSIQCMVYTEGLGNNESLDRTEPNPQKDEHLNGYILQSSVILILVSP